MRVLAVAAHPDDETMFAGGMLAKHALAGDEVYVICTTRGEGGEVGDPPLTTKDHLGAVREAEMREACAALGVKEVVFLDFVDPSIEIGEPPLRVDAEPTVFSAAIREHIDRIRPDVLYTHGTNGEYGHPQHVFTREAVWSALESLRPWQPREVWTWCANAGVNAEDRITNKDDPADVVLEVGPYFERKLAAALYHRTQHAMFKRNTKSPDVESMLRRIEAYRRWEL